MRYIGPIKRNFMDGFKPTEIDERGRKVIGPILGLVIGGACSVQASSSGVLDYLNQIDPLAPYIPKSALAVGIMAFSVGVGYLARNKIPEF